MRAKSFRSAWLSHISANKPSACHARNTCMVVWGSNLLVIRGYGVQYRSSPATAASPSPLLSTAASSTRFLKKRPARAKHPAGSSRGGNLILMTKAVQNEAEATGMMKGVGRYRKSRPFTAPRDLTLRTSRLRRCREVEVGPMGDSRQTSAKHHSKLSAITRDKALGKVLRDLN